MTFGEYLHNKRKEQGMTLKEVSDRAGLSIVSINFYENNKKKPNLTNISKLAKALNLEFDELYEQWNNNKED